MAAESGKSSRSTIIGKWSGGTVTNVKSELTVNSSISGDGTHAGIVAVPGAGSLIANCMAIFTIDLAPSPAVRNFSFGLDSLRNYGRTSIHAPGFEEETANSEAVIDWIIPRRRF